MTRARDLGDFIADGAAAELVVDTTTLVVDSTNNRVGIGTASPSQALDVVGNATITTADNTTQLTLVSTDADANSGPILIFSRDSGSPADNDAGGTINFQFDDDAGNPTRTAAIFTTLVDASNGSEDGKIHIETMIGGAEAERFGIGPTEVVINEASVDLDFRVEGNGNANMLFVDAGNDRIGIGTGAPSMILDVDGSSGGNDVARFSGPNSGGLTFRNATSNEFILHTATSDALIFGTNGNNERFRIGTSGQLGIGGATYGTSGQVLTSGGASAAPTWADAGGGAYEVVSTSTISGTTSGVTFSSVAEGNYKIIVSDLVTSTDTQLKMQLYDSSNNQQNIGQNGQFAIWDGYWNTRQNQVSANNVTFNYGIDHIPTWGTLSCIIDIFNINDSAVTGNNNFQRVYGFYKLIGHNGGSHDNGFVVYGGFGVDDDKAVNKITIDTTGGTQSSGKIQLLKIA